jgi:hypothetical protein
VDWRQVLWFVRLLPRVGNFQNENEENDMTSKITTILTAAIVLASAGVASAQTNRHAVAQWQAPYYNQDTRNLRFGHTNDPVFDVYGGTR